MMKKIYLKNRLFLAQKITQTPFNIDQVKATFLQAILTEIATKTEMPNDYNSGWLCENSDTIAVCNYIQLMCDKLLNC